MHARVAAVGDGQQDAQLGRRSSKGLWGFSLPCASMVAGMSANRRLSKGKGIGCSVGAFPYHARNGVSRQATASGASGRGKGMGPGLG